MEKSTGAKKSILESYIAPAISKNRKKWDDSNRPESLIHQLTITHWNAGNLDARNLKRTRWTGSAFLTEVEKERKILSIVPENRLILPSGQLLSLQCSSFVNENYRKTTDLYDKWHRIVWKTKWNAG